MSPTMTGDGPLVIFGTGGSGTRVVARVAARAGYFLGARRNESEDALELAEFFDRWLNEYLAQSRWLDGLEDPTEPVPPAMDAAG